MESKIEKKNYQFFWTKQKYISKFSGRLLIGYNDSLDVLLLDKIYLQFKRVEMTLPIL